MIEWIIGSVVGALAGVVLAGIFWDEIKSWATWLWDQLANEILAQYVVDAFVGGLVTIINIAGRLYKRAYRSFRSRSETWTLQRDQVIYEDDLPKEIRDALRYKAEVPVLRMY